MKKWLYLLAFLLLLGIANVIINGQIPAAAGPVNEKVNMNKLDVEEFFYEKDGTFVLRDVNNGKTFVYDEKRAQQEFTPESTFKPVNALIGLQVEAVRDEYHIKEWDKVVRDFPIWNEDHTLGSAMKHSVVWYYQDMARHIGEERMQEWIDKIEYGNQDISGGIDRFWLDSSMQITPLQQADFMEALHKEKLPFDNDVMKTVKRMMLEEEGEGYTIYGKTATRLSDSGLGWYTGFIESGKRTYVFVTNIDGSGEEAKEITRNILDNYYRISGE
ncbi:class D beta-lactamase [Alteribacillus sp. HJP-4]|uniref:class D beta-lactamase n=1 Tax=Alteribacillus sp. HJP-4 TaxID=2775394 RepID=UPI0035CCF29E